MSTANDDSGRTADMWWAWHDADSSRWSADVEAAEARCIAWVDGESPDGPDVDAIDHVLGAGTSAALIDDVYHTLRSLRG